MSNKIILENGTEAMVLARANTGPWFPGMDKWAWEMLQLEKLNEEMMKLTNPEAIKDAEKLKKSNADKVSLQWREAIEKKYSCPEGCDCSYDKRKN